MANNSLALGRTFHALADPTRRAVVMQLAKRESATVGELASQFNIGLPAFLKHLRVLKEGGLIVSSKSGRVRTCTLKRERIANAAVWLSDLHRQTEARMDRFSAYVESLERPKGKKS